MICIRCSYVMCLGVRVDVSVDVSVGYGDFKVIQRNCDSNP